MAKSKLKMTGFARLLVALIFIIPLAYLGATFIKGGDGLTDLKQKLGIEAPVATPVEATEAVVPAERSKIPPPMEKAGQDEEAMNKMREKLNGMYDENSALKEEVEKLRKQLKEATKDQ